MCWIPAFSWKGDISTDSFCYEPEEPGLTNMGWLVVINGMGRPRCIKKKNLIQWGVFLDVPALMFYHVALPPGLLLAPYYFIRARILICSSAKTFALSHTRPAACFTYSCIILSIPARPWRDVALTRRMSLQPRLNRVILRFKAPGVVLIT